MNTTYKVEGVTFQKFNELCIKQVINEGPSSGDVTEMIGSQRGVLVCRLFLDHQPLQIPQAFQISEVSELCCV